MFLLLFLIWNEINVPSCPGQNLGDDMFSSHPVHISNCLSVLDVVGGNDSRSVLLLF